jgi:hypothetical protein
VLLVADIPDEHSRPSSTGKYLISQVAPDGPQRRSNEDEVEELGEPVVTKPEGNHHAVLAVHGQIDDSSVRPEPAGRGARGIGVDGLFSQVEPQPVARAQSVALDLVIAKPSVFDRSSDLGSREV